jgi:transposase-like protein
MDNKKRLSGKEKMMVLRELLENKIQIGELAEKHKLHPNVIYNWKKTLFEKGEMLFEMKGERTSGKSEEKVIRLEEKLKNKDSLISEIVEDNIRLKKKLTGED